MLMRTLEREAGSPMGTRGKAATSQRGRVVQRVGRESCEGFERTGSNALLQPALISVRFQSGADESGDRVG